MPVLKRAERRAAVLDAVKEVAYHDGRADAVTAVIGLHLLGLIVPLAEDHLNDSFDFISEAVFTGLRRREGITYEEALRAFRTGSESSGAHADSAASAAAKEGFWRIFSDAKDEAEDYAKRGLLIIDNEGLRLTERGIDISNSIMSLFV